MLSNDIQIQISKERTQSGADDDDASQCKGYRMFSIDIDLIGISIRKLIDFGKNQSEQFIIAITTTT